MAMAILAPLSEPDGREIAEVTARAVADGLTAAGLDIRSPAWDESNYLKITNVRATFCEITIDEDGCAAWEYRPFSGSGTDPGRITSMIADILGADAMEDRGALPRRFPGVTLKGIVGRTLREEHGMAVRLNVIGLDDAFYEVYAEIEIMNPDRPERGTVLLDDDGVIRWESHFPERAADITGISPAEFTATVARILVGSPKRPAAS